MPTWLRNFTFFEIQNHFNEQNKTSENPTQKGSSILVNSDGTVNKQAFKNASEPYKSKTNYK